MPGLKDSRWAARDPRSSSVPALSNHSRSRGRQKKSDAVTSHPDQLPVTAGVASSEFSRYAKIVRRMKWKLPFLDIAYRQATSAPGEGNAGRAEAELMFKLDFFEYYMLCERALVHLQGVFGITISRDVGLAAAVSAGNNRIIVPTHRYHANVLEALDHETNPLHRILGVGDVRWQLARAKDLRNRWKNADDDAARPRGSADGKPSIAPLAAYDLEGILSSIHAGLDRAFVVAADFVATGSTRGPDDATMAARPYLSVMDLSPDASEEEEWGFMVEAMDWEAV